jgi:plastocyanin
MKIAIAPFFALALAAAACGSSSNNNTIDSPASSTVQALSCSGITPAATVTVTGTTSFMFSPMTVSIHPNDVVRFMTSSFHPVQSGTPSAPDGKFGPTSGDNCFKFTAAGTFPFFCNVHLFTGTVTVQ